MIVYPKTINHIAVSVTNLDKAVKWYQEVFGFNVINGPVDIVADDSPGSGSKRYPWSKLKESASCLVKYRQPSRY